MFNRIPLNADRSDLFDIIAQLEQELADLKAEHEELENSFIDVTKQYARLDVQHERLRAEYEELKKLADDRYYGKHKALSDLTALKQLVRDYLTILDGVAPAFVTPTLLKYEEKLKQAIKEE